MGRVSITIHIDYPDGAVATVTPSAVATDADPMDEAPWPTGADTVQAVVGVCPVHHVPWKMVPGGVSKRTGKAYLPFQACPEMGCNEKPR
jgi:hypothetical protein